MEEEVLNDSSSSAFVGLSNSKQPSSSNTTIAFFERMETITAHRDQFLLSASGELQKQLEAHQPAIQYSKRATQRNESPSRMDSSDHESVSCRSPELGPRNPLNISQSSSSGRLEEIYDQLLSKLQFMQVTFCEVSSGRTIVLSNSCPLNFEFH